MVLARYLIKVGINLEVDVYIILTLEVLQKGEERKKAIAVVVLSSQLFF
jgi:hypothetical protein